MASLTLSLSILHLSHPRGSCSHTFPFPGTLISVFAGFLLSHTALKAVSTRCAFLNSTPNHWQRREPRRPSAFLMPYKCILSPYHHTFSMSELNLQRFHMSCLLVKESYCNCYVFIVLLGRKKLRANLMPKYNYWNKGGGIRIQGREFSTQEAVFVFSH